MKTKTIIKVLSLFLTLALFLTSCTTEKNEIENNDTINTLNNFNRFETSMVLEVNIKYIKDISNERKNEIRAFYRNVAGLLSYTSLRNGDEVWTVNEDIWNSYEGDCSSCQCALCSVIESEDDVDKVTLP